MSTTPRLEAEPAQSFSAPRSPRRWRRAGARLVAALVVVLACGLAVVGVSYARALLAPGYASWTDRTVGWVRAHGGAPLVDAAENWYFTRHAPPTTPPDRASLPLGPGGAAATVPALPTLPNVSGLLDEAVWVPGRTANDGRPAAYHSYFQPDPAHAGVIVGVALLRAGETVTHLVAGTTQPGGVWPGGAHVPSAAVPDLVATFNSGYRLADTRGGFYSRGRTGKPLVAGAASLVVDDLGRISVGAWGRDVTMSPHVSAVRQNLSLVVEHGRPVSGLGANAGGRWGSSGSQRQYTWRSGLGVDRHGDSIYVAGNHLDLPTLARSLAQAGAVTGMELDIHSRMVTYSWWTPGPAGAVDAHKLLPTMPGDPERYLAADQRDFLYVTAR